MPKLTRRFPSYRLHKASGQAVVTLDGRDHYLGPHGSHDSKQKYEQLIGQWLARRAKRSNEQPQKTAAMPPSLVGEVLLAFDQWAQSYYRRDGKLSREYTNIKHAARPLAKLYGMTAVDELDIHAFECVQVAMVRDGLSRRVVNDRMRRIRFIIKWAAARKHVPASVQMAVLGVRSLRKGQHGVRECERVKPVADSSIDAVRPHLPPTLNAMITLQLLTGMRPGEVTIMRTCDIETGDSLWMYRPHSHKTDYLGHERRITIGPRAQFVLRPFLSHDLNAYIFSPQKAQAERRIKSDRNMSSKTRKKKRCPKRAPGLKYTTQTYGRAIRYGCEKAGIDVWSPNQLRHAAATRIRGEHGIEAARVILGHRSLEVTQIYAEVDAKQIRDIVKVIG